MATKTEKKLDDARAVQQAADLFKQASDPTRLRVLVLLKGGGRNVTEMLGDLGIPSQPALSHHLALLRASRLVRVTRRGKTSDYGLTPAGAVLADAAAAMVEEVR